MTTQKKAKQVAEFPADRPIEGVKEDRLSRSSFAEALAQRIRNWRGKESIVLSLCGEWGCGKTSLKNMVLQYLRRGRSAKVDVLEFNPWEISGHGSVAATFFHELAAKIAPADHSATEQKQKAAERLDHYGKLLSFGGTALKVIGHSMDVMLLPGATIAQGLGNAATQAAEVTASGSEAQAATITKEPTLGELKHQLRADMAKLTKPILVVIDDIDRLTHDEIREVFQLVKANANFPNLIYLLMFDRAIVASALDSISGGRGHVFLDKIVQVPFDVPQPPIENVHRVLLEGISASLVKPHIDERWDNERWQQIWWAGLSHYFSNLRSVYRFVGSYSFLVSHMEREGAFELNPLDLLVLETFRLFEPALYIALSARRGLLTDTKHHRGYVKPGELEKIVEQEISELAALSKLKSREEAIPEMLGILFPAVLMHEDRNTSDLLRDLRVGHKDIFDRYFTLSLSSGEITQAEVNALRQNFSSPQKFYQLCQSLKNQQRLTAAFVRLESHKTALPDAVFPQIIASLVDAGDLLPPETKQGFLSFDPLTCAYRIVYFGLRKFVDEQIRFDHLKTGLTQSSGVSLAVQLLASEERYPTRGSSDFLISEEHWNGLKPIVLQRIRDAASNLKLKTAQELSYILWRWKKWAGLEEVSQWLASCLKTPEDALWILRTFLSTMTATSSKTTYTRYLSLKELGEFSDVETLSALTQHYDLKELTQDDMRALRAFRYALKWRNEGKPDDYGREYRGRQNPLTEDT